MQPAPWPAAHDRPKIGDQYHSDEAGTVEVRAMWHDGVVVTSFDETFLASYLWSEFFNLFEQLPA